MWMGQEGYHTLKYVVSKNSQVFFFTDKLNQKCSTATDYIIYLFSIVFGEGAEKHFTTL